jgi:hypothetical protein
LTDTNEVRQTQIGACNFKTAPNKTLFANQCGAFHFGLSVRVNSCKAAADFPASKCQVLTNGFSMLVRDNFTPPFAVPERL